MIFTHKQTPLCDIAEVSGRLDLSTANLFEEKLHALLDEGVQHLVLDCQMVDYISSMGLRAILEAGKDIKSHGGKLILLAKPGFVADVFEDSGFTLLFPLVYSLESAESLLKEEPS